MLDEAILAAISALLDEHVLGDAVDRACSRLTADVEKHRAQMIGVERELVGIQLRIERLLDALGDGSLPRDEVAGRLNAEKSRKDTLTAARDRLTSVLRATDVDAARIKAELLVKIQDVKALLGRHSPKRGRCSGNSSPTRSSSSLWARAEKGATSSEEPSRSIG